MKKLISLALALVLVLSMSTVAFAAGYDDSLDKGTTFTKEYVVTNGTAPAETFDFNVTYKSFTDNEGQSATAASHPTVTLGDAVFANSLSATTTADVSVAISDYKDVALGKYTYEITEVVPETKTAGVNYNSTPVYLVVTILRDEESANHYVAAVHYETESGEKTGKITNSYDAGKLTVEKQITGNMADMSKKFAFTVVFTPAAGTEFNTDVQITNDNATTDRVYTPTEGENGSYTIEFELGDDETATFTNIPVGTTYTVTEDSAGYTSDHTTPADGTIAGGDTDTDVWTNTLQSEIDTGIAMDSMPYILLLAVACIGLFGFITKKRMMREF